jgi:hypothetical protein
MPPPNAKWVKAGEPADWTGEEEGGPVRGAGPPEDDFGNPTKKLVVPSAPPRSERPKSTRAEESLQGEYDADNDESRTGQTVANWFIKRHPAGG